MPDIILPGSAGRIEARYQRQKNPGAPMALVLHPHPQFGGTMNNPLVYDLFHMFHGLGCTTVRFNFRGVGKSEGEHDEGGGESDDLVTVAEWALREKPGAVLWLAGFSFGSYVLLRAAPRLAPAQVILIAPPVGRWEFSGIEWPKCPVLIVQGEDDDVVDPAAVFAWAETQDPQPTLVRMPGTGHFFHRRLIDLRGAVRNAVRDNLPPLLAGTA